MAWAVAAAALRGGAMWAASSGSRTAGASCGSLTALTAVFELFFFIFLLLLFEIFFGRFLLGSLEERSFFSFSSGGPAADLVKIDLDVMFIKCLLHSCFIRWCTFIGQNIFLEHLWCLESFHLVLMLSAPPLLLAIFVGSRFDGSHLVPLLLAIFDNKPNLMYPLPLVGHLWWISLSSAPSWFLWNT